MVLGTRGRLSFQHGSFRSRAALCEQTQLPRLWASLFVIPDIFPLFLPHLSEASLAGAPKSQGQTKQWAFHMGKCSLLRKCQDQNVP